MALDWEKRLVEKLNIRISDGVTGGLIVIIFFWNCLDKEEKMEIYFNF